MPTRYQVNFSDAEIASQVPRQWKGGMGEVRIAADAWGQAMFQSFDDHVEKWIDHPAPGGAIGFTADIVIPFNLGDCMIRFNPVAPLTNGIATVKRTTSISVV